MSTLKKGFTIVELLVVIAVIAILVGLVTTAASSSIRAARERRADAMRSTLQAGLAAYYAREGEWPSGISSVAEGNGRTQDANVKVLDKSEANLAFQMLVKKSLESGVAPYLDVSGLYVAAEKTATLSDNNSNRGGYGRDFKDVYGKNAGSTVMSINDMVFGYQDKRTGYFKRFWIKYNYMTDSVKVQLTKSADE